MRNETGDFQIGSFTYSVENGITEGDTVCSLYARVSSVFIDHTTMEQTYQLEFKHAVLNEIYKIKVEYSELLTSGISSLMRLGLDVTNSNKQSLSNALLASIPYAEVVFVVTSYGFNKFKGMQIFITDKVLSKEPIKELLVVQNNKYDLAPKGSLVDWLQMYEDYVKGYPPLELAVVLGLSGPIICHLNQSYPDLKTLLVNFSGDSSKGKTTALSLAVSVAGEPNKGHQSLLRSWNGTSNANLGLLEGVYGIPIAFDELSANSTRNLDSLLYTLTEGVGRSRARSDGRLREVSTWSTTILSSGELDIFNRLSENTGLKMRVFNFRDIPWTESADQSEAIKACITANHGWLLSAFIEYLFTEDADIEHYFEEAIEALRDDSNLTITSERVFKKLAVITATANLLNDTEILEVDVKAIYDLVVSQENEANQTRDIGKQAHERLMQYLLANQSLISSGSRSKIGYIEGQTVCIYRDQLTKILKELGFEDARIVRKKWLESNVIVPSESDRVTTRKVIEGQKHISYRISIPDAYAEEGLRDVRPVGTSTYSLPSHPRLQSTLVDELHSNEENPTIETSEGFDLDDSDIDF